MESIQLLFLYIGDIGRNIRDESISFSDEYQVEYVKEKKTLHIKQLDSYPKKIYERNILGIDLLVGRNGSGKSTVMNLLGMGEADRRREFPIWKEGEESRENLHTWFAVYHLKQNFFAVEGYNPDALSFLAQFSRLYESTFSTVFRYDMERKVAENAFFSDRINTFTFPHTKILAVRKICFMCYSSRLTRSWCKSISSSNEGAYCTFLRHNLSLRTGNALLLKYLQNSLFDNSLKKIMEAQPSSVYLSIELKNPYEYLEFMEKKDEFSKYVYGDTNLLVDMPMPMVDGQMGIERMFSNRQSMVLRYLEILIINRYVESERKLKGPKKYQEKNGTRNEKYLHRKKYLLDYLESMQSIIIRKEEIDNCLLLEQDWILVNLFCKGIESIDERFFKDGSHIVIPLKEYEKEKNFLNILMDALDRNDDNRVEHEINHSYYIRTSYHNLSSGEMEFIHFFASLENAIDWIPEKATCILLLDEPDAYFHPEWSRRFIESLTTILSSRVFRKVDYQIVVSTHSPILLSDIPVHHIHCLSMKSNGNVRISSSKYGFLSNINTIMLDSMFVRSSFGSFAEKYVNSILKKLNRMDQYKITEKNKEIFLKQIREIENRMRIILDPVIRRYLEQRLFFLRERIYEMPLNGKEKKIKELLSKIRRLEIEEN